ncbi:hypothetical protein [Chryseobacterium wanjuense]
MLYALVFLLLGCREELDYVSNESSSQNSYQLTKDNIKTQILKKTDYENKKFLKPDVNRISNFLKVQHNAGSSLSKSTEIVNGYEIYTDTFEEVSYMDTKYYSFYIIGENTNDYEEKLVLKSINNKVTEKYIVKYKLLPNFSIDPSSYMTFKIVENSGNTNGSSLIMYVDTFSMGCSTYTVTTYNCGHQGNHSNGQYCTVLNINIPYDTVIVSFDPNCMNGGSSGNPTGGGGGGGGGSPNNTPTPPVITIPTTAPLYVVQRPKGIECNPLGLDLEEIDQINNNYNLRLRIYQYLATKSAYPLQCSENGLLLDETKTLIKAILAYFKDHPTEDFSTISPNVR